MDIAALAHRLSKLQPQSGGQKIFWKPTEEETSIRIVPYPHHKDQNPFIEMFFHYDVGGERSIVCPKEVAGKPCPICELADEFKKMGGKENWKLYMDLRPKLRTYSPIIIRGRESEGVFLWGYGVQIYEQLVKTAMNKKWGDFTDVESGLDLSVQLIKKGKAGNEKGQFDKTTIMFDRVNSPLADSKKGITDILKSIPNFIEDEEVWKLKTTEELQEIVKKLANISEPSETSDDVEPQTKTDSDSEPVSSKPKSSAGDSLKDRLSALLED